MEATLKLTNKMFASLRDTGESIQGTFKGTKNSASTHVFYYIKCVRAYARKCTRARECNQLTKL